MGTTPRLTNGERQYLAGYDAGRTLALQTGSSTAGRRWLAEHTQHAADDDSQLAFVAGYEWALWDYEDANGLTHTDASNQVAG